MTKLTVTDIADEILKVFDLDDEALAVAMEELHNRVKSPGGRSKGGHKDADRELSALRQVQREGIARVRKDQVRILLASGAQAPVSRQP